MGTTSVEPPQQLYGACKSAHVLRMDLDSFGTQTPHFALIPRSPLPSALALAPSSGSLLGQTSGVKGQGSLQFLGLDNSRSTTWNKSAASSEDCP